MAAENEVKSESVADSPTSVLEDEVSSHFSAVCVFCW